MFAQVRPRICSATLAIPLKSQLVGSVTPSIDPVSQSKIASFRCVRKFLPKFMNPSLAAAIRFFTNWIGLVKIAFRTATPLSMMPWISPSE